MNDAHLHLLINHLPIIIPIIGLLLLLSSLILKSPIFSRAAFCIFIVGAITAIGASFTGEGAEEVLEELLSVDHDLIKNHENVAEIFATLSYILGALSLLALWANWTKKAYSLIMSFAVLAFAVVTIYFAQKTGTTGGEIRHSEIRVQNENIK